MGHDYRNISIGKHPVSRCAPIRESKGNITDGKIEIRGSVVSPNVNIGGQQTLIAVGKLDQVSALKKIYNLIMSKSQEMRTAEEREILKIVDSILD